jgi:hypothetical protein
MDRRCGGLLTTLLLSGLLTGCGAAEPAPLEGEPALSESLPQVDMSTFTLPLDAYEMTREQGRTIYQARNILIVRCMRRFGFTIVPPPLGEPSPGGQNERRYLIHSEARARTYGYKWPEITNEPRVPEPELEPAGSAALTGRGASQIGGVAVPEGGCVGEAARGLGLHNDANAGIALLHRLGNEAYTRMQKDSRVAAATIRWSECMQRAGYHYPDPARANNDPSFGSNETTPAEIATAIEDVKCKKETSLINIMAAVEVAYQRRVIERHQQQLRALQAETEAQIKKAADVIAGAK